MVKTRIYFFQFWGIIVLLCGYLLHDRPDRLSMMHFDLSTKSVIKIDRTDVDYITGEATSISSRQHSHKHKTTRTKHISFDLMLPIMHSNYVFAASAPVSHSYTLPDSYSYLFFAEINPPPPRC